MFLGGGYILGVMTMAKYIDIEPLRKQMVEFKMIVEQFSKNSSFLSAYISGIDAVMETIDQQPTTDIQEVKHGYWIRESIGYGVTRYKCSVCGRRFGEDIIEDFQSNKFCSNCGAKMYSEEE